MAPLAVEVLVDVLMSVRPGDGPAGGVAVVLDHGEGTAGGIGRDGEADDVRRRELQC